MIDESYFWKRELYRQSLLLDKYTKQKRWTDASYARCEMALMLGFYSIRKLIEAEKLTTALAKSEIAVRLYMPTSKRSSRLNRHKLDELYDLRSANKEKRKLSFICNQFIHSYIFTLGFRASNGIKSVFVSSDKERKKHLIEVEIKTIIQLFRKVSKDDRVAVQYIFDVESGDYFSSDIPS